MAAIQKRDGPRPWRAQVRLKGYPPESATFERKGDAEKWAQKTEADMRAGRHFGASKRHTFKDLVDEFKPYSKDPERLDYWAGVFGTDTLDTITAARIAKERDKLLAEEIQRYKTKPTGDAEKDAKREKLTRSPATVNRYLAALSVAMGYAVKELQWLERNPCQAMRKPKEPKGRVRFLSEGELKALLAACEKHADLYLAVLLALSTGARKAEVMGLRYRQVDFDLKRITLDKTKNGDTRVVSLAGKAFEVLKARSKVRNLKDDRVFPPTKHAEVQDYIDLRDSWEAALRAAGIENFHWHDLRHTAASYMAMSGRSMVEIAKVLGHRTLQMVARYSHMSPEHSAEIGEKLAARMGI